MTIVAKGFLVLIACIIRSGNFRFVVDAFHVPTKQHMVVRDSTYTCRSCPLLPATTSATTSTALPAWGLGKTMVVGGAAVCVRKAVRVIKQGDVSIVERLGKFHKRLEPGFHVLIPFVDQIRATLTEREQVLDIPPQKCITSDNAPLSADAVVYWRIVNAEKSIYAVVNLELAIQNLVLTQLRAEIGKLTLDMTFSAREQINQILLEELDVATAPWGVKITRVEVRDIVPNTEILRAMEMQMAAERTKRASIIKSEGERARSINEAEGKARSKIIDAEAAAQSVILEADAEACKIETEANGAARALDVIAVAMGGGGGSSTNNTSCDSEGKPIVTATAKAEAVQFQLTREYIQTQRDLATSKNAKVIITTTGVGAGPSGRAGSANSAGNTDNAAIDEVFAKASAYYDTATTSASTDRTDSTISRDRWEDGM